MIGCFPKRVSFKEKCLVRHIDEKSSEMCPQIKSRVYFTENDLRGFKSDVRKVRIQLVKQARLSFKSNQGLLLSEHVSLILATDETMRGFEARLCPIRIQNRKMVMSAVLQYQKELNALSIAFSPQQVETLLANAYSELSRWAKDQAIKTAKNDECRACLQNEVRATSTIRSVSNGKRPFATKRGLHGEAEEIEKKKLIKFC